MAATLQREGGREKVEARGNRSEPSGAEDGQAVCRALWVGQDSLKLTQGSRERRARGNVGEDVEAGSSMGSQRSNASQAEPLQSGPCHLDSWWKGSPRGPAMCQGLGFMTEHGPEVYWCVCARHYRRVRGCPRSQRGKTGLHLKGSGCVHDPKASCLSLMTWLRLQWVCWG